MKEKAKREQHARESCKDPKEGRKKGDAEAEALSVLGIFGSMECRDRNLNSVRIR
jgi:hypothetical protein